MPTVPAFDTPLDHERRHPQAPAAGKTPATGAVPAVLSLQRLAGNAAVASLLATERDARTAPTPNVQRLIPELWDLNNNAPNRRGRSYANRAAPNWDMNAEGLGAYIKAFIEHLHTKEQLEALVDSKAPCKALFDYYWRINKACDRDWVWRVYGFVESGRTRAHVADLELLNLPVNGANLTKIDGRAQLSWGKWFRYAPENFAARHDPEIDVMVAGAKWGVIHLHYAPGTPDKVWENEKKVGHLKTPQGGNDRYQVDDEWLDRAHQKVLADGGARPVQNA